MTQQILFYFAVRWSRSSRRLLVITRSNAVHALLYLIVSLLARRGDVLRRWARRSPPRSRSSSTPAPSWCCSSSCVMMLDLRGGAIERERVVASGSASGSGPAVLAAVLLAELLWTLPGGAGERGRRAWSARSRSAPRSTAPTSLGVELAASCCSAALVGAFHIGRRTLDPRRERRAHDGGPLHPRAWRWRRSCSRIGLAGVLVRRNLIFMLMSIEIMLNAGGLALVAAGARWGQADGQVMFLFVLPPPPPRSRSAWRS